MVQAKLSEFTVEVGSAALENCRPVSCCSNLDTSSIATPMHVLDRIHEPSSAPLHAGINVITITEKDSWFSQ